MRFGVHQTFHIREGWLFKGMDAIRRDPRAFMASDALDRLGLGKNMIRALRFWIKSTGLAEEYWENQLTVQRLTDPFGQLVWKYDRYQEEKGTLWLLHYHLVREQDEATAWYWFFNHFSQPVFGSQSFVSALQNWVIGVEGKSQSEKSLKRDFDCLIHTYISDREARSPEDLIECPLAQLGLLTKADNSHTRRFHLQRPDPNHIHPLLVLYVLLRWQQDHQPDARQVGLAQVLREPGNIGRVFNLGTAGLSNRLTRLNDNYPELAVRLTRTAGLDQLTLPQVTTDQVLTLYYETRQYGYE
jgi:hypothetical protein